MIDTSRHFFPIEFLKDLIDDMASQKLNLLQIHLTDDDGWRVEIKKYPKLTEIGAWRGTECPLPNTREGETFKRYGGFYTQEQIKDVFAYATARHITIVPEIEMPGHAAAAITAYPELGNSDIPGYSPKVVTRWGVFPYIFAPKEETFRFIDDVMTEVCALFPSKFIHIGGDEAPKSQWHQSKFAQDLMKREGLKNEEELQSWFVKRVEKILESKNRRLIGWDEIQEGGLPKTAAMMVWRDAKWAKHALAKPPEPPLPAPGTSGCASPLHRKTGLSSGISLSAKIRRERKMSNVVPATLTTDYSDGEWRSCWTTSAGRVVVLGQSLRPG